MTFRTATSPLLTAFIITLTLSALPMPLAASGDEEKNVYLRIVLFEDKKEAKAALKEIRAGDKRLALIAKERYKGGKDVDEYGYRGSVAINELAGRLRRALKRLKEGKVTGVIKLKDKTYAIAEAVELKYLIRGSAAYTVQNYKDAEPDLKRHIELNPDALNARVMLGSIYEEWGRQDDAAEAYEAATGVGPLPEHAYAMLGRHYIKKGNIRKARETYEKGLLHFPNSSELNDSLDAAYILMINEEGVIP